VPRKLRAQRYAQAVFEIALERNELDRWQSDLKQIARLKGDAALLSWLLSPKFSFRDKARLFKRHLGDINPLVLNLVYLLVAKGKFDMIGDIANGYEQLVASYRGIERALLTTAVPLEDEDKLELEKHLSTLVGKKVVLEPEVDSSIIGGFKVRIGDKLIDGSTRSKLQALREELASTR